MDLPNPLRRYIYHVLCHFFWRNFASCRNFASICQLANQLLLLLEQWALKRYPQNSKSSLSFSRLSTPQVPLIHIAFCACLAPGACSARDINLLVELLEKRLTTSSLRKPSCWHFVNDQKPSQQKLKLLTIEVSYPQCTDAVKVRK